MSALAPFTTANREFFEKKKGRPKATWVDWIKRGVVRGKIIDGEPFVDLNHFAANDVFEPVAEPKTRINGADLLRSRRSR